MGNLCSPTRLHVGNNSHSAGAEASQPPANTFFFFQERSLSSPGHPRTGKHAKGHGLEQIVILQKWLMRLLLQCDGCHGSPLNHGYKHLPLSETLRHPIVNS